jgi:ATP-dependent Lhr-like helicase
MNAPHPLIERLFEGRGWQPHDFQKETWSAYAEGKSGLLHAPTGTGKTLAVWLGPVAEAMDAREAPQGCRVIWLTPLRALAQDTARSLSEPLHALGSGLEVAVRTGDTSSYRKAKLRERLPFALVTTPESLSLMLTYEDSRSKLEQLTCVVIDEWHELLGTKRGVQTELCLARLRAWHPDLRVWGLSATLGNLDEARETLLGSAFPGSAMISADLNKELIIETLIPDEIERFPWAGHLGTRLVEPVAKAIESADTTLLFTNTRSQTELWFQELLEARPAWKDELAMHHGSLDREERENVEQQLREGTLRCVVCTSSLDLGVDFSPVDQVIQVGSPKGVARLAQRAGRSGHQPGKPSRVLCVPTHAFELIEFDAAREALAWGEIESRTPLVKPLDVLVQHLVTCIIGAPIRPTDLRREIQTSHAYRDLSDEEWDWALGFITTGGQALKNYPQYHKARLENDCLKLDDKKLIQQHRLSIGTITGDRSVSVQFLGGKRLGTIEESFITRLRPGSPFIFGGRHLELVRFHKQTASVRKATKSHRGHVPIWNGGKMPLSSELSHAISRCLNDPQSLSAERLALEPILAIQNTKSALPSDDTLLIEFTRTREGEHLFFYPLAGRLVHEGLGSLVAWRLGQGSKETLHITQNDYGFSLTARRGLSLDLGKLTKAFDSNNLLDDLMACMNTAELARRQFREIARVAGLIVPDFPGRQKVKRDLQTSTSLLFEVFQRYDSGNLLLLQSQREILSKQFEINRLEQVLTSISQRPFHLIETERLTPLAFPLWADRLSATLPAGDANSRLEAMLEMLNRD